MARSFHQILHSSFMLLEVTIWKNKENEMHILWHCFQAMCHPKVSQGNKPWSYKRSTIDALLMECSSMISCSLTIDLNATIQDDFKWRLCDKILGQSNILNNLMQEKLSMQMMWQEVSIRFHTRASCWRSPFLENKRKWNAHFVTWLSVNVPS